MTKQKLDAGLSLEKATMPKKAIIGNCPITCGQPTRMTEASFRAHCRRQRESRPAEGFGCFGKAGESRRADKWEAPAICQICGGGQPPPELELMPLAGLLAALNNQHQQEATEMATTKQTSGDNRDAQADILDQAARLLDYDGKSGDGLLDAMRALLAARADAQAEIVRLTGELAAAEELKTFREANAGLTARVGELEANAGSWPGHTAIDGHLLDLDLDAMRGQITGLDPDRIAMLRDAA